MSKNGRAQEPETPRLLGRPGIEPGTSLAGYCWTLDGANLELGGAWLAHALGLDIDSLNVSLKAPGILARATMQPVEAILRATLAAVPGRLPGQIGIKFGGCRLDRHNLVGDGIRMCPACSAEGRPHQAEWDLEPVVCCRRHDVWLIDRCPECRELLRHSRSLPACCDCGWAFAGAPATPAPPILVDATRWALGGVPAIADHAGPEGAWPPTIPVGSALSLLLGLGGCFRDGSHLVQVEGAASPQLRKLRETVCDSAELLGNWPVNFAEAIERQAAAGSRYHDFVSALGLAYNRLFQSPGADDFGCFQEIVDARIHQLSSGRLFAWKPLPRSVEEAARAGAVLEAKDVRFILNVDKTELNQLVRDRLIAILPHPREHAARPYLVPKAEVDGLLASLAAGGSDRDRPAIQAIAFQGARRVLRAIGGSLPDLVRILQTRMVKTAGRDPDQRGLSAPLVDYDSLLAYVLDPVHWSREMTLRDLQTVLQLPKGNASALLGSLITAGRPDVVDTERLREFIKAYVFPGRVALALGVPRTAVDSALEARGLNPVKINGSALVLFRRGDLEELIGNRPLHADSRTRAPGTS